MYITSIDGLKKMSNNISFYKILSDAEVIDNSKEDGMFYTINNVFNTIKPRKINEKLFILEIDLDKMTHNVAIFEDGFYTEEICYKNIILLSEFLNNNIDILLLTTMIVLNNKSIKNLINAYVIHQTV